MEAVKSKIFNCIIKCLYERKHQHMLKWIGKMEFEVTLKHRRCPTWRPRDISFLVELDSLFESKYQSRDDMSRRSRFNSRMTMLCKSVLHETTSTYQDLTVSKSFKKRRFKIINPKVCNLGLKAETGKKCDLINLPNSIKNIHDVYGNSIHPFINTENGGNMNNYTYVDFYASTTPFVNVGKGGTSTNMREKETCVKSCTDKKNCIPTACVNIGEENMNGKENANCIVPYTSTNMRANASNFAVSTFCPSLRDKGVAVRNDGISLPSVFVTNEITTELLQAFCPFIQSQGIQQIFIYPCILNGSDNGTGSSVPNNIPDPKGKIHDVHVYDFSQQSDARKEGNVNSYGDGKFCLLTSFTPANVQEKEKNSKNHTISIISTPIRTDGEIPENKEMPANTCIISLPLLASKNKTKSGIQVFYPLKHPSNAVLDKECTLQTSNDQVVLNQFFIHADDASEQNNVIENNSSEPDVVDKIQNFKMFNLEEESIVDMQSDNEESLNSLFWKDDIPAFPMGKNNEKRSCNRQSYNNDFLQTGDIGENVSDMLCGNEESFNLNTFNSSMFSVNESKNKLQNNEEKSFMEWCQSYKYSCPQIQDMGVQQFYSDNLSASLSVESQSRRYLKVATY